MAYIPMGHISSKRDSEALRLGSWIYCRIECWCGLQCISRTLNIMIYSIGRVELWTKWEASQFVQAQRHPATCSPDPGRRVPDSLRKQCLGDFDSCSDARKSTPTSIKNFYNTQQPDICGEYFRSLFCATCFKMRCQVHLDPKPRIHWAIFRGSKGISFKIFTACIILKLHRVNSYTRKLHKLQSKTYPGGVFKILHVVKNSLKEMSVVPRKIAQWIHDLGSILDLRPWISLSIGTKKYCTSITVF